MSKRKLRQPSQGWLIWLTVQDSPSENEDYLSFESIASQIRESLNAIGGLRVTRLRVQTLPRVQKQTKILGNPPKSAT